METIFGDSTEREFPAEPDAEVDIHILSGMLTVEGRDDDAVRVQASGDEDSDIIFTREGNRLIFRHHPTHGSHEIDLHLTVPSRCSVIAESVHSDIDVRHTVGPLRLHTVHGDLTVSHVGGDNGTISLESVEGDIDVSHATGELTVNSVNGDVNLAHISGVLSGQTSNGDIHVERAELRRFHVNTMNGEIHVDTPLTGGEHYYGRSTNGDINLYVPQDSAFVLQMKTVNGEVKCDLPHEMVNGSRRNRQVRINGGGATVELETTNGGILVSSRGPSRHTNSGTRDDVHPTPSTPLSPNVPVSPVVPPLPPIPPTSLAPGGDDVLDLTHLSNLDDLTKFDDSGSTAGNEGAETTLDVLAKLEAGELTVDQAMERLEALR